MTYISCMAGRRLLRAVLEEPALQRWLLGRAAFGLGLRRDLQPQDRHRPAEQQAQVHPPSSPN